MKETSHLAYHEFSCRKCILQQAELPQVWYCKDPLLCLTAPSESSAEEYGGWHRLSSMVAFSLLCSTAVPSMLPLAAAEPLRMLPCSWWPNKHEPPSAFSQKESTLQTDKQFPSSPFSVLFYPHSKQPLCTSRIPAAVRQTNRLCLQLVSGIKIILSELWYKMLNRACAVLFG